MKGVRHDKYEGIGFALIFLFSFLSFIVSSLAMFLDIVFVLPALISFSVWLILTLLSLRSKNVDMIGLLKKGKLLTSSRLLLHERLHGFYIATLLSSLMLFFGMLLLTEGYQVLVAFLIWLFIGYLTTEELGEGEEAKKESLAPVH